MPRLRPRRSRVVSPLALIELAIARRELAITRATALVHAVVRAVLHAVVCAGPRSVVWGRVRVV